MESISGQHDGKFLRIRSSNISCNDAPKGFKAPRKLAALDRLEKMEILIDFSVAENSSNAQQRRNSLQEYERKFAQVSEDQKLP